jgi:hypothetical protein
MPTDAYVPRTSSDEDASHKLDAERTAWESSREHDPGTGSPQAKGEKATKRNRPNKTNDGDDTPAEGDTPSK